MIYQKGSIDIIIRRDTDAPEFERLGFSLKSDQKNTLTGGVSQIFKKTKTGHIACIVENKIIPAFTKAGFIETLEEQKPLELILDDDSKKPSRGRASTSK